MKRMTFPRIDGGVASECPFDLSLLKSRSKFRAFKKADCWVRFLQLYMYIIELSHFLVEH